MARRHNLRLIKRHRTYTAMELCETLSISMSTVWSWRKAGLQPIPGTWPFLYAPDEIMTFLKRREQPRCRLQPGEIFSVAVRGARIPRDGFVDLVSRSPTSVDLVGTCPDTGRRIFRRARRDKLGEVLGNLQVRYEDDQAPYGSSGDCPRTDDSSECAR